MAKDIIINNTTYSGIETLTVKDTNNEDVVFSLGGAPSDITVERTNLDEEVLLFDNDGNSLEITKENTLEYGEIMNMTEIETEVTTGTYLITDTTVQGSETVEVNLALKQQSFAYWSEIQDFTYRTTVVITYQDAQGNVLTPEQIEEWQPFVLVSVTPGTLLTMQEIYDLGITDPTEQQNAYDAHTLYDEVAVTLMLAE